MVAFDHYDPLRPARGCLETKSPAARKKIEAGAAGEVLPEPVEERFANSVRRWAEIGACGEVDAPAAPCAADDSDLVCFVARKACLPRALHSTVRAVRHARRTGQPRSSPCARGGCGAETRCGPGRR